MKKFQCDICGMEVDQYDLYDIDSDYEMGMQGIKHICKVCNGAVEEFQVKIRDIYHEIKKPWIRMFLLRMKNKKS